MAYPYGTQGAPAVGNGLGGLPRRAVAAAAAATQRTRYDLQLLSTISIGVMPTNATLVSPPILMNGKGLMYFTRTDPSVYRHTFDYSVDGITNNASTYIDGGSTITQLPSLGSSTSNSNAYAMCQWSQSVSANQSLFKYTRLKPFLVTWNGSGDSSFSYPTNPSGVQISDLADSFLLPSGNLICFGHDGGNTISLAEFSPTLTHIRSLTLGTLSGLSGGLFRANVKRTSYGYVVGLTHANDGIGARCLGVTLNASCTTVIATRAGYIQRATGAGSLPFSTLCGQDGVMFVSLGNSAAQFGSLNMPTLSDGTFPTVASTQYYGDEQTEFGQAALRSLVGNTVESMGCTKYAESIAPTLFYTGSGYNGNKGLVMFGKTASSSQTAISYVDMQLDPVISALPSLTTTVYPGDATKTVNGVMSVYESYQYGINLATDDNGFVYMNSSSNYTNARLFKKVYR